MNEIYAKDMAIMSMMYLVLVDMGYSPALFDPTDPSLISHCGPHTTFTLALTIRDDTVFPENEFADRLEAYSKLSTVKPHFSAVEYFPAIIPDPSAEIDPVTGTLPAIPLRNFSTVYIEVFV